MPNQKDNKHPLPYTERQRTHPLSCEVPKTDPSHPLHDIPDELIKNPTRYPGTYSNRSKSTDLEKSQAHKKNRTAHLRKDAERNRELVTQLQYFAYLPSTKDPAEVQNRMRAYFEFLENTGGFPMFEEVCYTIGFTPKTVNKWINGNVPSDLHPDVVNFLSNMKNFCNSMLARKAVEGEVNNAIYIFMSKNWYGMKDQTETIVHQTTDRTQKSDEEIMKILEADIVEFDEIDSTEI